MNRRRYPQSRWCKHFATIHPALGRYGRTTHISRAAVAFIAYYIGTEPFNSTATRIAKRLGTWSFRFGGRPRLRRRYTS